MNIPVKTTSLISGAMLQLVQGDITEETTDAIVNAANAHLQHGAGVAGAISHRGGPEIQAESDAWVRKHGPVSHTNPAWTSGGKLSCRYVIHAVGPVWSGGQGAGTGREEDADLGTAVTGCLRVADELGLMSISLPAISTGIFGFPKERAAELILTSIQNYFKSSPKSTIRTTRVVVYDNSTLAAFLKAWHDYFDT